MNTIFVGGSRRISHLPAQAKDRLNNVVGSGFHVLVGDANGADKAVQKHLLQSAYRKVTVFCSGDRCRNNLANWPTRTIQAPEEAKGFQFYALKDREMAREADFGLMIWDGEKCWHSSERFAPHCCREEGRTYQRPKEKHNIFQDACRLEGLPGTM
jgi:hypothetical protein